MLEEFPFPIQRIQSDRGLEFFATKVQEKFMEYGIKFRPVKPASPHLNGKVERSQKTETPSQVDAELSEETPLHEEVSALYDPSKERIQIANYYIDTKLRELK